jgi:protein SCO1
MMPIIRTAVAALVVSAIAAGCARGEREVKEYELTGQVLAVDPARQEITIRHEDIPQFMPGMTMAFRVREPELLAGRVPGDLVAATLVVTGEDVHLRRLERTGSAPVPVDAATPPRVLAPGDEVADATFVDQTGAERTLAGWRGHALAVTFTYTRCPLPNFCPLIDRQFGRVQQLIGTGSTGTVQLLSVSVDPEYDRPPVLAAHAQSLDADPAMWVFLTGDGEVIRRFASQFGVSIISTAETPDEVVHNLRTAVIDPDGRLVTIFGGGDWDPADLAQALRDARASR